MKEGEWNFLNIFVQEGAVSADRKCCENFTYVWRAPFLISAFIYQCISIPEKRSDTISICFKSGNGLCTDIDVSHSKGEGKIVRTTPFLGFVIYVCCRCKVKLE
jgi:hypothetical protein